MTEMEQKDLESLFVRISRLEDDFITPCEREEFEKEKIRDGVRIFKNAVFGFFRNDNVKTLEEMARLLYKLGMVSSIEEAKRITPSLDGLRILSGFWVGGCNEYLAIDKVQKGNDERYRISNKLVEVDSAP